ncbi:uncharacterized protein LOC111407539 isoform X2 [Olea europaea var. sylvestris]|uniref:uncharacterized protein LOC111407539 isoform X2 n=1 Tax=Olea europaea var. sylvestris TaxID=158386 RepID=UPI000C1D8191|nr:uncharacterized protein LOC111407539 isoform X2 [Olea europaea var. sylvestris]
MMEKIVEKSGSVKFPKKKGSLDLQSMYNSRDSEEEQNGAKTSEVCDLQDGKKKKKNRKNRKSPSLSSFESEAKKSRKDCGNRVMVVSGSRGKTTSDSDLEAKRSTEHCGNSLTVGSGSCGKLTSGIMGFDGSSLTSRENENVFRFPKHPRSSVEPKKLKNDQFSKLSGVSNSVDLGSGSSGRLTIHSKSEAKKGKEDCGNSTKVGSGASEKLTSGSEEFDGLSLTSRENEYAFRFPKHPRSSLGPKKFKSDRVSKRSELSNSVDPVVKINDKVKKAKDDGNLEDQLVNLVKSSAYKVDSSKEKQKTVFNKVKRSRNSGMSSSRHANQENDPVSVNNVDTSSKKKRINNRKRKDVAAHGDGSGSNAKRADPSAGSSVSGSVFIDFLEDNDYDEESLEQNAARMLSSRFDPNCTGYPSNKKSIVSQSTNEFSSLDYPDRDLFSRESNSSTHLESASADLENGVLRKKKDQRGKNNSRKRRHFYEILPEGLDPYWVLKRKIKVLRHEDWHSGIVHNYNPLQKLHFVKYDDRFEEWIDLQKEKFKLLLLRSEVPGKGKPQKSSDGDNIGDTEPIISWLARSGRTKSLPNPLKKQKTMRMLPPMVSPSLSDKNDNANKDVGFLERGRSKLDYDFRVPDNLIVGGRLDDSLVGARSSSQIRVYVRRRSYEQGERFLVPSILNEGLVVGERLDDSLLATPCSSQHRVYVRRCSNKQGERFLLRTIHDDGKLRMSDAAVGSKRLICLSSVPSFEYSIGTWDLRLSHSVLILQYGVMVTTSPAVILEMLFVDSVYGLRFFLFEGCLKQAVAFVSLILTVFNQPNERWNDDAELPVTSVSVRFSSVQDLKKRHVFEFYNFSKVKNSEWLYLDSKLLRRCLLIKQLPVYECTYSNITALECGSFQLSKPCVGLELSSVENHVWQSMGSRESCQSSYRQAAKHGRPHPFGNPEDATQQIVEDCMQVASPSVSTQDIHAQRNFGTVDVQNGKPTSSEVTVCTSNSITWASSNPTCDSSFGVTSVKIPSCAQVDMPYDGRRHNARERSDVGWSMSDGFVHSPNPTLPRSSRHHARYRSSASPFGNLSPVCSYRKTKSMLNDLSCGLKKPPNQIQYALCFADCNANNQITLPSRRIRKASEKSVSDCPRSSQRNLELESCRANLLVIVEDKRWRERGAQIVLELADRNEWRLAVKLSGSTRYSYKVQHNWKAESSNHYTNVMMWKGGEDWLLEFSDRSQWMLFKELHEECHNRNIRAASVKNIPIPGVRLIEDSVDYATEVPFVQNSSEYFHQVETDVEMATNPSHFLYDMDSEDEHWLMSKKKSSFTDKNGFEEISDESFEKMMDMLEKFSYVENRLHFTLDEIEGLMVGIGSKEVAKVIYEHWRQKRERKGMPLVRQLQPPLWERYQKELKEWELAIARGSNAVLVGNPEKASPPEKPPMFAFCLKPRGMDVPKKRSKQRSKRKFSVSGYNHIVSGRRSRRVALGDNKVVFPRNVAESIDALSSPQTTKRVLPRREASRLGRFSLSDDMFEWDFRPKTCQKKTKKIQSFSSFNKQMIASHSQRSAANRNVLPDEPNQEHQYFEGSHNPGLEPLDASTAAQHLRSMAELKRDKANRLFYQADVFTHKAAAALLKADVIKAAAENSKGNG